MEADWEVEIGGDSPVIDGCWDGLIDLRNSPEHASVLPETRQLSGLADVLARLNAASSPVWTSKCDVFQVAEFDPDELDAQPGEGNCGLACYIDLLPRTDRQWSLPERAVEFCRVIRALLRSALLRRCRADLIVRRAYVGPHLESQGITMYITACGPTLDEARATLEAALRVCGECFLRANPGSTLQ